MADFIKVYRQGDDKEVLLNRDHVVSVEDNQDGCIVTLSTGATVKLDRDCGGFEEIVLSRFVWPPTLVTPCRLQHGVSRLDLRRGGEGPK
jgi:hypothetical protein